MALSPQPFVESPNLRSPIALVVDDPAPCINPLWYFRHQVDGQSNPVSFMESWSQWVSESDVRGDFTILPYPAGLGRIDHQLEGYETSELRAWVQLARDFVMPQFDIHAEILTHTNALDRQTGTLLPISEHEWSEAQDEAALADYFASALQILKEAGVPNHGITQPCFYRSDESVYARALLAAEKRINQRSVTHNFLHMDSVGPFVPPRITHLDEAAGEAVVSVWTGTDDYIWNTQEPDSPESAQSPEILADRFLTGEGQAGRLAELRDGGGPIVMVTHWQSLYSSGSGLGLKTYQELIRRIAAVWDGQVEWCKLSEITQRFLAMQTARWQIQTTPTEINLTVSSAFAADVLTLSIPTPWPLYRGPQVWINGRPATQVSEKAHLQVDHWIMRGSMVTVSMPLSPGQPTQIRIQAMPE